MKAKLIQTVCGEMICTTVDADNILAAFEVRGYTLNRLLRSTSLRSELQGLPVFNELCGPMYDGAGFVRYEDGASYDSLSV